MGRRADTWKSDGTVQALASQIPEFAGHEEDNVRAWVCRVDKVAQVHGATDGMILLTASTRLTKSARRWFDFQGDNAVKSWRNLRAEMVKIFDRQVPLYRVMQKNRGAKVGAAQRNA